MTSEEEWRVVGKYSGRYEVSSLGQVRIAKSHVPKRIGTLRRLVVDQYGYITVAMSAGGIRHTEFVHGLVAAAFIGPRPHGMEVNHKNGNKSDNRPCNLEYVTPSENARHAIRTGLAVPRRGAENGNSKFTESTISALRSDHATKHWTLDELAAMYSMSKKSVQNITKGRSWKHVALDSMQLNRGE